MLGNMKASISFTKDHTLITKGILIVMMLIHHLFYPDMLETYEISTILANSDLLEHISGFCKMCVPGFAFLSAFGITSSLMKTQDDIDNASSYCFKIVCKRLIKLGSVVAFIYIVAIFFKRFVMLESIRELYDMGNGFSIVYMVIDVLGLAKYFGTPMINITWWYLTYAVLLIVSMPFIFLAYKKYRYLILPVGCLLPGAFSMKFSFSSLLPCVILGTAFAYEGWMEKIHTLNKNIFTKIFVIIIEGAGIWFSYLLYRNTDITYSYVFVFLIPLFVVDVVAYVPVLRHVLKFLGRHATNIFLTHTFIYYYFYTEFIYSFKEDWLILSVMLLICTLLSVILEFVKKISCFNLLIDKILVRMKLE